MTNKKVNSLSSHGKKNNRICFVAGRSGGHIVPCLTLARSYQQKNPDTSVLFFCSSKPLDVTIMQTQGNHIDTSIYLPLKQLSGRSPFALVQTAYSFFISCVLSLWYLCRQRPTSILTTGSDVAIPVVLVGYLLRIPITLYEVNAVPGKTIRFLARFASEIKLCFAQTAQFFPGKRCSIASYPLRFTTHVPTKKTVHMPTLLVLGGSQGSQFINKLVQNVYIQYPELKQQVALIHQYGNDVSVNWDAWYAQNGISAQTYRYTDNLAQLYEQADLVLCRAGAGSLFETIAFAKKMICIPLECGQTDHQLDNAYACAQAYPALCRVIRQHELETPEKLYLALASVLSLGQP